MKRVNIMHIIGTYFLLCLLSCKTLTLSEMIANDILDNLNNGGSRYDNSFINTVSTLEESEQDLTISENYFKEVIKMEQPEVITMITSIIAGLYAVVKTCINLFRKIKK